MLAAEGPSVPGAISADLAWAAGRATEAADGYRAQLAEDPDDVSALVGLGLALVARSTGPAARALLHRPELVRAVHRTLRTGPAPTPSIEAVAGWIGRFTS